jgi:hypothetical protein
MTSEKPTKVAEASAISVSKSECCRSTPSLGLHNGPVMNCRPPVNPTTRPPEAGRVTTSDRPTGRRPRPLQACESRPASFIALLGCGLHFRLGELEEHHGSLGGEY